MGVYKQRIQQKNFFVKTVRVQNQVADPKQNSTCGTITGGLKSRMGMYDSRPHIF